MGSTLEGNSALGGLLSLTASPSPWDGSICHCQKPVTIIRPCLQLLTPPSCQWEHCDLQLGLPSCLEPPPGGQGPWKCPHAWGLSPHGLSPFVSLARSLSQWLEDFQHEEGTREGAGLAFTRRHFHRILLVRARLGWPCLPGQRRGGEPQRTSSHIHSLTQPEAKREEEGDNGQLKIVEK